MAFIFGKTKKQAPRILDQENFEPVKHYSKHGSNHRIVYQGVEYESAIFDRVILAEMALRGLVQRHDSVEKKLDQPVSTPEDKLKVQQWEEELQSLQKEILLKQHELYRNEAFLPHKPLKQMTVQKEVAAAVGAVDAAKAAI
ncbi:hypothetical protein N7471_007223 [Penicillium samsonianum]|uniref:uncharacterized protein n=1 Tax=Penicillium samsonianum TaxID=1882272 RepID=UPI002548FE77|nr:uncharacterized protein N7471_007223 [Penicillium samsonianum]KAJ6132008.1 hypothetical protein N7471_007223 [Penicillium samsonianum]